MSLPPLRLSRHPMIPQHEDERAVYGQVGEEGDTVQEEHIHKAFPFVGAA